MENYSNVPFLWWNDLDNTRLHSVLVDLVNEPLEVAELVHCLRKACQRVRSGFA